MPTSDTTLNDIFSDPVMKEYLKKAKAKPKSVPAADFMDSCPHCGTLNRGPVCYQCKGLL